MAKRPIFIPHRQGPELVTERTIDFTWHPGMAASQKQKSILSLHAAAKQVGYSPVLEISTKSPDPHGVHLSAFNLKVETDDLGHIPLECAFQGSKVFQHGGPYTELYRASAREARKDLRIRNSGELIGFSFDGQDFPLEPKTGFYDWLYIRALCSFCDELNQLKEHAAFTDIEFNPSKSINCQARSCATYVAMLEQEILYDVIKSSKSFLEAIRKDSARQPHSRDDTPGLFSA